MSRLHKPLLCFVASHPMSVTSFLLPHLKALSVDSRLMVLLNTKESDLLIRRGIDVPAEYAPIERSVRPRKDLQTLWLLYRKFRQIRPDAVHTITPKAGLLGMAAAWLAQVPVRVHTFTGQVWVTRTGVMRLVLQMADRCIAMLATDVLVDSPSQRDFLIEHRIVSASRSAVLGDGSICGVDLVRFAPNSDDRANLRAELGVLQDETLLLYLGRLNRDKGLLDLAHAFQEIARFRPNLKLLIVGPDEEGIYPEIEQITQSVANQLIRVGFTTQPERYMRAADVFCLPSYREGFGSSVIEAAGCGIPAVASRIYGVTDAVKDGVTGILHTPADLAALVSCLEKMVDDQALRLQMGRSARTYVEASFSQESITGKMVEFYNARLG